MKDTDDSDDTKPIDIEWRADSAGHRRFRGKATPGRMRVVDNDKLDFALAMKSMAAARDLFVAAPQLADPRERREVRRTAKGQLVLVRRFIDELLGRER